MARIPLQSDIFAEAHAHARDRGQPTTQAQLRHFADLHAAMPPSKAHLKRNARAKAEKFVEAVPVKREPSAATLIAREQNEWMKRQMAQLGGTRTVAADEAGTLYNAAERGLMCYVEPVRSQAFGEFPDPAKAPCKLKAERRRLDEHTQRAKLEILAVRVRGYAASMEAALAE